VRDEKLKTRDMGERRKRMKRKRQKKVKKKLR